MAAAIVLLAWFATTAQLAPWPRARGGARCRSPLLALWMTDSRGGIVAALIALAILLATGAGAHAPGRQPRARRAGRAGADRRSPRPATSCSTIPVARPPPAQGDQMLAITLLVVRRRGRRCATRSTRRSPRSGSRAASASRRWRRSPSPRWSRVVVVDPIEQFDEFKEPPTASELAERRGRPAARRRQRPLPVLGDGGRRLRRAPRSTASARAATRPTGSSTARCRSPPPAPTRCSSRPSPSSASPGSPLIVGFFAVAAGRRHPALARAPAVAELGAGAGACSRSASRPPRSTGPGTCRRSSCRP